MHINGRVHISSNKYYLTNKYSKLKPCFLKMKILSWQVLWTLSGRWANCYNLCEEQFGDVYQKVLEMTILL